MQSTNETFFYSKLEEAIKNIKIKGLGYREKRPRMEVNHPRPLPHFVWCKHSSVQCNDAPNGSGCLVPRQHICLHGLLRNKMEWKQTACSYPCQVERKPFGLINTTMHWHKSSQVWVDVCTHPNHICMYLQGFKNISMMKNEAVNSNPKCKCNV